MKRHLHQQLHCGAESLSLALGGAEHAPAVPEARGGGGANLRVSLQLCTADVRRRETVEPLLVSLNRKGKK